jgi:hypothetical protein
LEYKNINFYSKSDQDPDPHPDPDPHRLKMPDPQHWLYRTVPGEFITYLDFVSEILMGIFFPVWRLSLASLKKV